MPYGLTYMGPQGEEEDPVAAAVRELMASLEPSPQMQPPAAPPPVGAGRSIMGGLGDALLSMASVRSGGAPMAMGPFAAGQRERQKTYEERMMEFEKRQAENAAADRAMRNKAKLDMALIGKRRGNIQPYIRDSYFGIDDRPDSPTKGQRVRITDFYDKFNPDALLGSEYGEETPFAPAIMPGMEIDPQTGKPSARILRIPKTGGPATAVTGMGGATIEAMPPAGLIESVGGEAGVVQGIPTVMDVFNKAAESVGGSEGMLRQFKNWAVSKAGGTSIGPIVAPPEVVNYFSSVRAVLFPYVKSVSGAAFPEQELRRYESQFPLPGVDPPDVAANKWNVLIQQMVRDIKAKYGAAGRTPPSTPSQPVEDEAAKLFREIFGRAPE